MNLSKNKMAERKPEHTQDWYIDDDGFRDTLEEMADHLESKYSGTLPSSVAQRLGELKEEMAKIKISPVYNTNNS
ncbi:MAG: hypothetical protein ACD_24C00341G0005 [uncultured bacterium]|nr:MAG: hypothetical protein ACD_24C00341G0005 [uncultured bacterium]